MICNQTVCTGCASCYNVCPANAITMNEDSEGFLRPYIDESKCIHCGLCEKCCPELNPVNLFPTSDSVYACWSLDDSTRMSSSSGGVFSELARATMRDGGIVFASGCDEELHLHFRGLEKESDLEFARQSKYWQSDIRNTFIEIKKALQENRRVLFVGTPCQVAGLRAFLGAMSNSPYLCAVDLICGSVPSPGVFRKYTDYLRSVFGQDVCSINMRDKTKSWEFPRTSIVLRSGKKQTLRQKYDWFKTGFYLHLFSRPCCEHCRYTLKSRVGDITIGDYWGLGGLEPFPYPKKKGVSVVLCNSPKGEDYFAINKDYCFTSQRRIEELTQPALHHPIRFNRKRSQFFDDFKKEPIELIIKKYFKRSLKLRIRRTIASILPASICALFLKSNR